VVLVTGGVGVAEFVQENASVFRVKRSEQLQCRLLALLRHARRENGCLFT